MTLRPFHQASWNEPILLDLSSPGERGIIPPPVESSLSDSDGDPLAGIPAALRRSQPPALPELSQPRVLRHYLRLSQETLGNDVDIHLGLGTCTMKYSPKVNEELIRSPKVGPSWKGIFGKMEAMTAGAPMKVDVNYLRESMMDPQAHIVMGFAPAMPTYQGKLSDKDIDGLIELIKSLK